MILSLPYGDTGAHIESDACWWLNGIPVLGDSVLRGSVSISHPSPTPPWIHKWADRSSFLA